MNCWFDVPLLSDGEARLEHDSVFGWMGYPEDFQTRDDYFRDGLALIRTVNNQTEKLQKVVADYLHFAKDPSSVSRAGNLPALTTHDKNEETQ